MTQELKVGLAQMSAADCPDKNLASAIDKIEEAARRGATIVCLQELFRSRYFCQEEKVSAFDLSETIPGPTTEALGRIAQELQILLIVPLFEKRAEGVYHNSAVVLDRQGQIAGLYRKMHIPDDPHYYEKFYFTPGDLGFRTHRTSQADIGVLICWDQWFPEAARLTALSGAQILFYPTAIGWLDGQSEATNKAQHEAWEISQRAHAIANGLFVAAVNRVGREGRLNFWGQSFVADPLGQILARAAPDRAETLIVSCDLSLVERTRREWCFLRDRRVDAYYDLTRLFIDRDSDKRAHP